MTKTLRDTIKAIIEESFERMKGKFLGPEFMNKGFVFSLKNFDPKNTLSSVYLHANAINSFNKESVDKDNLDKINTVAQNYLDTLKQKSVADITRIVDDHLQEVKQKGKIEGEDPSSFLRSDVGKDVVRKIKNELKDQIVKINKGNELIVNVELGNAQNIGAMDGILSASKSLGVNDPVVMKIGVGDEKRCENCWNLWTMPDKKTPRLYKLSELTGSPGNYKNPSPSIGLTHPRCRDVISVLMPGFGFNANGKITYVSQDHDEFKKQRGS